MHVRDDVMKVTLAHELIHHIITGIGKYDLGCPSLATIVQDNRRLKNAIEFNGLWAMLVNGKSYVKADNDEGVEKVLKYIEHSLEKLRCLHGNELDTSKTIISLNDKYQLFNAAQLELEKGLFNSRMRAEYGLIRGVNNLNHYIRTLLDYLDSNPTTLMKDRVLRLVEKRNQFARAAREYKKFGEISWPSVKDL